MWDELWARADHNNSPGLTTTPSRDQQTLLHIQIIQSNTCWYNKHLQTYLEWLNAGKDYMNVMKTQLIVV